MVLENVKELWTEVPKNGKGKKNSKPVNKDRYISKMCLISGKKATEISAFYLPGLVTNGKDSMISDLFILKVI
uniref:Small nuclear ribonucleoprotein Sm D2 n=1 Tax=Balaenoptera musculus TaxID=9771 RepID=A0A8C0E4V1_BALMU